MQNPLNMVSSDAIVPCPNCRSSVERQELSTKGLGVVRCPECED